MSQLLAESRATLTRFGWGRAALLALLIVQVTLALMLPVAGPFSIDEVVISEMTRSLSSGFRFFIDNGVEQIASPALATINMEITEAGHLVGQYPYGLPVVAAPLYLLIGVRGILVINALAFVAAVALTYELARRYLDSKWVATSSAVVFVVATFAWEYSIAIWPHMFALALALGSVVTLWHAMEGSPRQNAIFAALAGLLFGLGVLSRLDAVLIFPLLAFTVIPHRRAWLRTSFAFIAGAVPPTIVMMWSNWERWATLLPFSYGGQIISWLVPLALTGISLGMLAMAVVYGHRRLPRPTRKTSLILWASVAVALLVVPYTRRFIINTVLGAWTLVVDLRTYRITDEGALVRLADGTLVYFGVVKKALLQSAPYLVVIALPLVVAWRTSQRRIAILLLVPVVTYVGFFAPRAWHGGLSFNLRYLLPMLPFAAILTAWAMRTVIDRVKKADSGRLARITAMVTLVAFAAGRILLPSITGTAWLLSVPPIGIAGATLVAMIFFLARSSPTVARTTLVLLVAGLTWAAAVSYGYDATATLNIRNSHVSVSTAVAELMGDDALLIAGWPDNTYGVKDHRENAFIALADNDDYASIIDVIATFSATRTVYGAMSTVDWDEMPETAEGVWVEIGNVADYSVRQLEPVR